MRAVALIGGKGTRLRPVTQTVPKSMVPLRNKPYVHYTVDTMRKAGLEGTVLSMGYLPEPIQRYFAGRDLDGFSLDCVVEERPLGTAGALRTPRYTWTTGLSWPSTGTY
jgi:NDP-sugar pyrophosphorylase family protein